MSKGFMAGRMIGANFEQDTLTFEMDRGYYAAAGRFVILREADYFQLTDQRLELLRALREIDATGKDSTDGGNHYACQQIAREAIANATQQRKEPGA